MNVLQYKKKLLNECDDFYLKSYVLDFDTKSAESISLQCFLKGLKISKRFVNLSYMDMIFT